MDMDTEQYMGQIMQKLAHFATMDKVREWTNKLLNSEIDYTNREELDDWYDSLFSQYGPKLVGTKSCVKQVTLHQVVTDLLPVYGNQPELCLCTR